MKYKDGWYDLMDGSRRINRQAWRAADAKQGNEQRRAAGIPARWVWGKQPGRPKKPKRSVDPKKLRPGQVWAKITVDRNGLHRVQTRTIIYARLETVIYTPRRAVFRCHLPDWWRWSKDAHCCRSANVAKLKRKLKT